MTQAAGVTIAVIWLIAILALTWTSLMGRQGFVTAPVAFVAYQSINVLGIVMMSRYDGSPEHLLWPFLVLGALTAFVLGGLVASQLLHFKASAEVPAWRDRPLIDDLRSQGSAALLILMAGVSIVVGVAFARSVGYNTFVDGLSQYLQNRSVNTADINQLRADATTGAYRAVGYVTQLTGFVLPTVAFIYWVIGRQRNLGAYRVFAVVLLLLDFYFVTVVGGRVYVVGTLVSFLLLVLRSTSPLPPGLRRRGVLGLAAVPVFVLIFGFATILQGRSANTSLSGAVDAGTVGVWNRLGGDYSGVQLQILDLLRDKGPAWGAQWWGELKIILPGASHGLTFDQQLHGAIFGSTRGNLPLDPWGSYWFNFGIAGLILVPFIVGLVLQWLTIKHLIRAPRRLSTVVVLSLASFRIVLLSDPYSLLLTGPVTLVLMLLFLRWTRDRAHMELAGHESRPVPDERCLVPDRDLVPS